MIVFFRYRYKWAHGINPWEHRCFFVSQMENLQALMDELGEELNDEFDWSDKYRGADVEHVDCPSQKWVEEHITRCQRAIQGQREKLSELEDLLPQKSSETNPGLDAATTALRSLAHAASNHYRAAEPDEPLEAGERLLHVLQHTVGGGERNMFCATLGSPDFDRCTTLVGLRLMKLGPWINEGQDRYFYATQTGKTTALTLRALFGEQP